MYSMFNQLVYLLRQKITDIKTLMTEKRDISHIYESLFVKIYRIVDAYDVCISSY
jgi:hypothetical protein